MRLILILLFCTPLMAQEKTSPEIFLFDLSSENNELRFENGKNISQNDGYDNQPSFYSDEVLLYAGTTKGQTEIFAYNIVSQEKTRISNTNQGSEYSPVRIPGTEQIAAVRLDTTGLQRLYRYQWDTGESGLLHEDLEIGYFAFYNAEKILASVLAGDGMELVLLDLEEQTARSIVRGAGRSLHKIPGTESMSYTWINEQGGVELYLLENVDEEPESVYFTTLPPGVQDYVWIDRNRILAGQGNKILIYDIWAESKWKQIADLSEYNLQNITRIALNAAGDKIVFAAEVNGK